MNGRCFRFPKTGRTEVMAIVNATPDSFSDGGRYFQPEEAARRMHNCVREGAAIIDLGCESTRPGATPLAWQEEWERLEPILALLAEMPLVRDGREIPLSIDTYHPETARRALQAGASIVNCVRGEAVAEMITHVNRFGAGLIAPCRAEADLEDLTFLDGFDALHARGGFCGDPEIGFDTTREEDLELLGGLRRLAHLVPVCVGVSRKRLIQKMTGEKMPGVGKNLGGSVGAAVWCALCGAALVRVHDVRETVQALGVANMLAKNERIHSERDVIV